MDWIRAFFGGLLLAMTLVLGAAIWTTPAGAQQIIIQGANVDPSTVKPYFTGTDQASIDRGVADLQATGMFSSVSARLENGKIVVTLSGSAQIVNRVAFEGNSKLETKQLEVEVQSKPHTAYSEETADGRRRANQGRLQENRLQRSAGDKKARPIAERARRSRLHRQRRRQNRRPRHQIRRQPRGFGLAACAA